MIDLQKALVADHIADLERERAALRAERERDHLRGHFATGTEPVDDPIDHVADALRFRARIGRWLVAVGQAIAGPATGQTGRARGDDPCADPADRFPRAA